MSTYLFSRLNCINFTYNWSSYIIAAYANPKMQVFCIADEDTEAEELKTDVKKFLYDLRMQAEVIVVTMKSWEVHQENRQGSEMTGREDAMEAFSKARKRIMQHAAELVKTASSSNQTRTEQNLLDDQQVKVFQSLTFLGFMQLFVMLHFSAYVEHTNHELGEGRGERKFMVLCSNGRAILGIDDMIVFCLTR